jgi:hypothetical protein
MTGRDGIALTDIVHLDEDNNVIREVSEDAFVFFECGEREQRQHRTAARGLTASHGERKEGAVVFTARGG